MRCPSMIEEIQKVICRYFKLDLQSLKSKSRRKEICYPRSIAVYLCREFTTHHLKVIGIAFNRKHPVILHNYKEIKRRLKFDNVLRNEVDFFTKIILLENNHQNQEMIEDLENEYLEIIGEDSYGI